MDWLLVYGTMSTWERTSKHGNEEVADLYMTSPDITIDFDSTGECRGELAKQTSIIDILINRHNHHPFWLKVAQERLLDNRPAHLSRAHGARPPKLRSCPPLIAVAIARELPSGTRLLLVVGLCPGFVQYHFGLC